MRITALLFLSTIGLLGACQHQAAPTPSRADLLTAKSWRLTGGHATYTGNNTNLSGPLEPCNLDDVLVFRAYKALHRDAGSLLCDPADLRYQLGTWDLPSDERLTLSLRSSDYGQSTYDIKELTATTLHLYGTESQHSYTLSRDLMLTAF